MATHAVRIERNQAYALWAMLVRAQGRQLGRRRRRQVCRERPIDALAFDKARIGILTVSDRASQGVYEDKGGPAIRAWFEQALLSPWEAVAKVIPD